VLSMSVEFYKSNCGESMSSLLSLSVLLVFEFNIS